MRKVVRKSAKKAHTLMVLVVLAVAAIAGCGDSADEEVTYYRHTDTVQCAPSATTQANISALATVLANAGVAVASIRCGRDNLAHPAACGVWNGEWWLVSTVGSAQDKMQSQGFSIASQVPTISEIPCG